MRPRSTRVGWGLLAVFAVGYLAVPLSFANGNVQREPGFYLALVLAFTAFMVVGAVVVAHRPGNAVGWIFSAIGLLSAVGVLTMEYAEYALLTRQGSLPGATLAAWFSWWWLPILGLIFVFTLLLFPTGRLPSPRWRPVAMVGGLAIAVVTVLGAVRPTLRLQNEEVYLANPVGVAGAPDPENGTLGAVLLGVLGACMVASAVSVVLRFRRSQGSSDSSSSGSPTPPPFSWRPTWSPFPSSRTGWPATCCSGCRSPSSRSPPAWPSSATASTTSTA
jgi:hypothetical protein